jgi:hypothetical protein
VRKMIVCRTLDPIVVVVDEAPAMPEPAESQF